MRGFAGYTVATLAAAVLLASCSGGGGGGGSLPATQSATLPAAGSTAASGAQFTISVARLASQAANRRTASISAGVASVVISAAGGANASTTINVAANAPGCTSTATSITCTGTINLLPGTYTFAAKEYDAANGAGNLLGTGTLNQTLAAGALTNVALTLNGVVKSIQLALNPTSMPSGAATTATLTVAALDASGNVIIGPGIYVDANGNPLTINVTTSGGSGISLSASQVTSAASAALNVTYNGTAVSAGTQALFHASATGIGTVPTTALTFTGAGSGSGSLYVVNDGFLEQFNAAATSTITQFFTPSFPRTIGFDAAGNFYLIGQSSVLEYAAGTGTNGKPLRTIGGTLFPSQFFSNSLPTVDSHGAVYGLEPNVGGNVVGVYSATASGNVAPDKTWTIGTISGTATAVAVDTDGSVYVASNDYNGSSYDAHLDVFPSSTPSGPVTPARTIVVTSVYYYFGNNFTALGFDAAHNVYAWDIQTNSVFTIAAGTPSGPYGTFNFSDSTGSYGESGFAVEPSGAVDVAFSGPSTHVDHFPPGASGSVTPAVLQPAPSGFNYVIGLGVSPSGPLGVLDDTGFIFNYTPAAVAAGGNVAAASNVAGVPFGVGNPENATLAPNGDVVIAGSGGPDTIEVYSAGTLGLGTPARSILASAVGNIGAAFEDAGGYLYATQEGPGGVGGDSIARRASGAASARAGRTPATRTPAALRPAAVRKTAGYFVGQNEVAVFAPGASGAVLPMRSISTPLQYISAATLLNGTLYLTGPAAVLVYPSGAGTPSLTIPYPGSNVVRSIAVDALGWIYITDGTTIYTIAPGSSNVAGSFPITSPGSGNSVLVTNATNLYVAVDAGLESYPLSAVRLAALNAPAPALNPGVLPVLDPAIANPYLYTAVFGN